MAEPKNEDFLDSLANAEAEELADEMSEISSEDAELDSLRAERDMLKDRFMRALADAENARKRSDIYTGPTAPAFLTPNLIAIIQEKFDMRSIGNV